MRLINVDEAEALSRQASRENATLFVRIATKYLVRFAFITFDFDLQKKHRIKHEENTSNIAI